MGTSPNGRTSLVVRVPRHLDERLDRLANEVNRTKSELVRFWLWKLGADDLPQGWREDAAALRTARSVR